MGYIEEIGEDKQKWDGAYGNAEELVKEELGETTDAKCLERESWFWNSDVQKAEKAEKGRI